MSKTSDFASFCGVQKFDQDHLFFQHLFANPNATFHTREMYIDQDEVSITPLLGKVNEKFKDKISLGSYPDFYNRWDGVDPQGCDFARLGFCPTDSSVSFQLLQSADHDRVSG